MSIGVTGLKRDRLPVRADGIVEQPDRLQDDAEVAVPVGLIRSGLETTGDEGQRFTAPAAMVGEHAGKVQRIRRVRDHREHPLQERAGFVQLIVLQTLDGDRGGFIDRQLAGRCRGFRHGSRVSLPCCP